MSLLLILLILAFIEPESPLHLLLCCRGIKLPFVHAVHLPKILYLNKFIFLFWPDLKICWQLPYRQCCETVTICSGSGSGSDIGKVSVPVPGPAPDIDHIWNSFKFFYTVHKILPF